MGPSDVTADASAHDAATDGGEDTGLVADANIEDVLAPLGANEAAVSGLVVDRDGAPVEGIRVLCCSLDLCQIADTRPDGSYLFWAIEPGPRKMELIDPTRAFTAVLFHQVAVAGERSELRRPVIAQPALEGHQAWPSELGGEVVLGEAGLRLRVDPGALHYPLGLEREEIAVRALPIEEIPPFAEEPWLQSEAQSYAFLFDPISLESDAMITLQHSPPEPLEPGLVFRIWTVDDVSSELIDAGTARVDAGGDIVSDPEATIDRLSMLYLVPEAEGS